MKSTHRLSVIATALLFSVSFARGQGGPEPSVLVGKIANWPAPATWSPESVSGGLSTMDAVTSPLPFIGLAPCRIADTRGNGFTGAYGPPALTAGVPRNFTLTGKCGIPAGAQAVSLNITVTNTQGPGFILIYPQGGAQPNVSTLNYVAGQTIANAAVVPLGILGGITVVAGVSGTNLILDTNGYYAPAGVGVANTFLGLEAGNFTMTGGANTGFGYNALNSNTTGTFNTGIGATALRSNTAGSGNTAVGNAALHEASDNNNVAIGHGALSSGAGSNNIAIGVSAGSNISTGSNNIFIGNLGSGDESGQIRIGTAGVQNGTVIQGIYGGAIAGLDVVINAGGRLGTTPSSRRFKEDIRDVDADSDGLMSLRPVAFQYKREIDPSGLAQYGLIAEEVAEIYPELVVYDAGGRPETIRYQLLDPLLLNELQKQHRSVEGQQKANEAQERTIEQQKAEIQALQARLSALETRLLSDSRP